MRECQEAWSTLWDSRWGLRGLIFSGRWPLWKGSTATCGVISSNGTWVTKCMRYLTSELEISLLFRWQGSLGPLYSNIRWARAANGWSSSSTRPGILEPEDFLNQQPSFYVDKVKFHIPRWTFFDGRGEFLKGGSPVSFISFGRFEA